MWNRNDYSGRNKKKLRGWNAKTYVAVFLSAALVFQSIDYMQVQAGESEEASLEEMEQEPGSFGEGEENPVRPEAGNETPTSPAEAGGESEEPEAPADSDEGGGAEGPPAGADEGGETEMPPTQPDEGGEEAETPTQTDEEGEATNPSIPGEGGETAELPTQTGEGGETPEPGEGGETIETPTEIGESEETTESSSGYGEDGEGTESQEDPTESEEETGEETTEEGTTEPETGGEDEIRFVRTAEGAIVILGFEPLSEKESHILLNEKKTLAEVQQQMPFSLKASAQAYYAHTEKTESEKSPQEPSGQRLAVTVGEASVRNIIARTGEISGTKTNVRMAATAEGEPPVRETQETEGDEPVLDAPAAEGEPSSPDVPTTEGEPSSPAAEEEPSVPEMPATEDDASDSEGSSIMEGEGETFLQEVTVPVIRWECSEDYEEEELEEYHFRPVLDSAEYFYSEEDVPVVTVSVEENLSDGIIVSTQEELEAALAAREGKILLAKDIALTATLTVPAAADTVLDGQGFSLCRGEGFLGTMIYLGGEGYTDVRYGTLTLTNICVDGQPDGGRGNAPAVIDYGRLVMGEGVIVRNNKNGGTHGEAARATTEGMIGGNGGGILVYGELIAKKESCITKNYAEEFGGGVYLADRSVLYLYADVITENDVAAGTGYGADIYASDGSTIFYDIGIDMEREGFYICSGADLICMQESGDDGTDKVDENVEIYLNVAQGSGYSDEQIAEIRKKLEEKGYTVLPERRINIDTTDLHDWYVYDHYDPAAWEGYSGSGEPPAWTEKYGADSKRKYYGYREQYCLTSVTNPVYTIADWLKRTDDYNIYNDYFGKKVMRLAHFQEHVYSRDQDGYPAMTFVGYGHPSYVDFLFYNPESNGEKVVDFDVDSSMILNHTLTGSGFLVNTGVEDDKLYGYLVYYTYAGDIVSTSATSVEIYQLNGISVTSFHGGVYDLQTSTGKAVLGTPIQVHTIDSSEWENVMSIQIRITPNKIEVRQQPKSATSNISTIDTVISCTLESESKYSGFGPLVAYTSVSHYCDIASSFTYQNLNMYYTNPELNKDDMLKPLEMADFTQDNTQKYFINLFGSSTIEYNESAALGQYQEYLELMQKEGVALVTDRNTPFDLYLGSGDGSDSNLHEMQRTLSVDELVDQIASYIDGKTTTDMQDKLQGSGEGEGLKKADSHHSAGNIWLKSVADNAQIRVPLHGDSFGENGYAVQIIDDITYYHENLEDIRVTYDILKPNASKYTPLFTVIPSSGEIVTDMMRETVGLPLVFVVDKDAEKWPNGQYAVRQKLSNGSICGYAFFDLFWDEPKPPEPPDPPEPSEPEPPESSEPEPPTETSEPEPTTEPSEPEPTTEPSEPEPTIEPSEPEPTVEPSEPEPTESETETVPPETIPDPPDPPKPVKPTKPKPIIKTVEPSAEAVHSEAVGTPAVTVVSRAVVVKTPKAAPAPEPKTGDAGMPVIPVSLGACTAFMLKIRLWLYELELGISEEKKNEMLRALASWAKGSAKPKIYLAVAASAAVLTLYHLLKALDAKIKQVVEKFGRK